MRCHLGRPLAFVVVLLASAVTAREALAINACTAAQISASDSSCPTGTGPCTISKSFDVANNCILDFGTRAVTVTGTITFDSNTITIKAGTFTVAAGGKLNGLGDSNTPPRNDGGRLRIETTGAVSVNNGSTQGRIDVSANNNAGDIVIVAGGTVTIGGQLRARDLDPDAAGGTIDITSAVSIITQSTALVDATGGNLAYGGSVSFTANGGNVDLGTLVDLRGGDGGDLTVFATSQAIIRAVDVSANGDAGSGGSVDILANGVQLLGLISGDGSVAALDDSGGDGADITIEADFGDIVMSNDMVAQGKGSDGSGGSIDMSAVGSITQQVGADMSLEGAGSFGYGGEVDIDAGIHFTSSALIDVSGGDVGGDVFILAGRNATFNDRVDATGRNPGSYGGTVFVQAGDEGQGNLTVAQRIDTGGGVCSMERGCGVGGSIELEGCDLTIGALAQVRNRAPTAGSIDLTSHEQLRVQGEVTATNNDATVGINGTNKYFYRSAKPPIVTGTVSPSATNAPMLTCTATVTTGCLTPCPTCGNGVVEYPETCDNNSGTPVSCDGCSATCQLESCNDGNGCTADSCDPTLGCNHSSLPEGTSCSDGNLCNGADVCHFGVCTSSTPLNCNDNNVCTTDSCIPATGCLHVNNSLPCNDGLFCNGLDMCSGGTCSLHTTNPCPGPDGDNNCAESCNEATDSCTAPDPNGSACSDGLFCNGADTCNGGTCTLHAGSPCPGPDGDGNCAESCDEAGGTCTAPDPDGSACTDGLFCTGADTCSGGICAIHAGDPCPGPDGDGNCAESCNETTDTCTAPDPDGSTCVDGLFCNGADTCSGGTCAVHAGDPCPGPDGDGNCAESCNEATDTCTAPDPDGSICTDGLFCNGADTCNGGSCSSHTGDPCPGPDGDADCVESCNETTDTCDANDPNGSPCLGGACQTGVCSETTTTTTSTTSTTTTSSSTTSTTIVAAVGHLKCYKAKDARAKATYALDLLAGVGGFPNEAGCKVKLGAKQICVEVGKQSVSPPPPGGGPASPPNAGSVFLSYKLKCPKQAVPSTVRVDQFGAGQFIVGPAAELLVPAFPGPANDHFECYKVKDTRGKATYSMDLIAGVAGFTNEIGCSIKLGASRVCVQVSKQNVVPTPPGGGPGPGPDSGATFIGYKLKCPKQPLPGGTFADQFGSGPLVPSKAATLLVPAF